MCTSQCSSICVRPQAAWVPTKMLDVHQNWVCPQKPRLPAGSCVDLNGGYNLLQFSGTITNTQFRGNWFSSPAIFLSGTMESCELVNNYGTVGLITSGSAAIYDSTFYNNTISGSVCGGILYFLSGNNEVHGCNFTGNRMGLCMTSYAISIYDDGGSLVINSTSFTGEIIDSGMVLTIHQLYFCRLISPCPSFLWWRLLFVAWCHLCQQYSSEKSIERWNTREHHHFAF